MKILLVNMPRDGEVKDVATPDYLLYDFMNYPPLGLLAVAAGVDPKHDLQVLDSPTRNMNIKDIISHIKDVRPDILGISVVTRRLYPMYAISKAVKEQLPDTKIVVGGPHANVFPMETMALGTVDFVLPGYGEKRFPMLVEALDHHAPQEVLLEKIPEMLYRVNGVIKVNPPEETSTNLDDLPFPNRKLINLDDYFSAADKLKMTTMYTSRGCPFRCVFCDVGEKTFRHRSPMKIVDEFESIAALGIQEIHMFDDTFNVNRQRVIDMCKEIIKRGLKISWSARARVVPIDREMISIMKQAGCRRLHVGVEAFDDNILKAIKKNITLEQIYTFFALCNEFKIDTLAYFIVGFPQETAEYRKSLFGKLKKLNATYLYLNILYPTAKSELYDDLLKDGTYDRDYWQEFVTKPVRDFELPLCRSTELQQELMVLVDDIHRKFYLSPKFIINDLRRNPNLKMLGKKAKIAIKLFMSTAFLKKKI
ncbi:MAG: radical SAM protein [Candidatus Omnitrophota bacterium]